MKDFNKFFLVVLALSGMMVLQSCQDAEGNQTGSEYVPDMAYSTAYDANIFIDYDYANFFEEKSTFDKRSLSEPRLPVKGTVPRRSTNDLAHQMTNSIKINGTGHVPYYYGDSEEERTRATNEIVNNPLPITDKGLAQGKELYTVYCGICHGTKGNGEGYLVREDGGKYPAAPANFLSEDLINSSNGRYYHAIMYGKNMMAAHADKLSHEERWNVIHFIRSMQAKEKGVRYDSKYNELNSGATPWLEIAKEKKYEAAHEVEMTEAVDETHSDNNAHGH